MADPTIQTFCCRNSNNNTIAFRLLQEFNTDVYNLVCLASSILGMIGAVYQILPRKQSPITHRWLSFSATRGRKIIIWLAVADLMASLGIFTRSILWLHTQTLLPKMGNQTSRLLCTVSAAWTQYFYAATWLWTLCYATDLRRVLTDRPAASICYHLISWGLPAALTIIGLAVLYLPDVDCHADSSISHAVLRILPNYLATYVPMIVVMIVNPLLYRLTTKDMEYLITSSHGQFTSREREIIDMIKIKFALINIVFYFCWMPNLINGILLWTLWFNLPFKLITVNWYIMAFVNPLQALLNCLVYRRWTWGTERISLPCQFICARQNKRSLNGSITGSLTSQTSSLHREENLPLLRSVPRNSINRHL